MILRFLCILVALLFSIIGLKAQDYPVSILDGPALQVDSTAVLPATKPSILPAPRVIIPYPGELSMSMVKG